MLEDYPDPPHFFNERDHLDSTPEKQLKSDHIKYIPTVPSVCSDLFSCPITLGKSVLHQSFLNQLPCSAAVLPALF